MTLGKTQLMYYLALKITNNYAMSFSNILKPYLTGRYVRLANTASSAQHNTTQHIVLCCVVKQTSKIRIQSAFFD